MVCNHIKVIRLKRFLHKEPAHHIMGTSAGSRVKETALQPVSRPARDVGPDHLPGGPCNESISEVGHYETLMRPEGCGLPRSSPSRFTPGSTPTGLLIIKNCSYHLASLVNACINACMRESVGHVRGQHSRVCFIKKSSLWTPGVYTGGSRVMGGRDLDILQLQDSSARLPRRPG